MKNTKSQFIRQYVRASKSPWDDSTTVLLLADIVDKKRWILVLQIMSICIVTV